MDIATSPQCSVTLSHSNYNSNAALMTNTTGKNDSVNNNVDVILLNENEYARSGIPKIHSNQDRFTRDTCDSSFSSRWHPKQHNLRKNVHAKSARFQCYICGYVTYKKRILTEHICAHIGEKPFMCEACDYKSSYERNLKQHIRTHTVRHPFKCHVCDLTFSYISLLKIHLQFHAERNSDGTGSFKCNSCDGTFETKLQLRRHMKTHSNIEPFECNVCTFMCTCELTLLEHARTHAVEKPFICEICPLRFFSSSSLKQHALSHKEILNLMKCQVCNTTFKSRRGLRLHIARHSSPQNHTAPTYKRRMKGKIRNTASRITDIV